MIEFVIQPDADDGVDTWLRSGGEADNNFGETPVATTGVQEVKAVSVYRFLLRLDLSSIPTGAKINDATLTFFWKGGTGLSSTLFYFNRVTRSWTELGATWNDPWVTPGGDFTTTDRSAATISNGSDLVFNDAGLVAQLQYGIDIANGFVEGLVKIDDESGGTHIITHPSSDGVTAVERQKLTLNYTPLVVPNCIITDQSVQRAAYY